MSDEVLKCQFAKQWEMSETGKRAIPDIVLPPIVSAKRPALFFAGSALLSVKMSGTSSKRGIALLSASERAGESIARFFSMYPPDGQRTANSPIPPGQIPNHYMPA